MYNLPYIFFILIFYSTRVNGFFNSIYCRYYECCDDRWISSDFTDLSKTLQEKVHGQHLAIPAVIKHLKGQERKNMKANVLSFHGCTGTGKGYVSRIIVNSTFKMGMSSKFVHFISFTKDYNHAEEKIEAYMKRLKQQIEIAVRDCPRALFILDEMDKIPPGLIDALKPYLKFYEPTDGVDYRKATYLITSNSGCTSILNHTLKHWHDNKERENIKFKEMEDILSMAAFNEGVFKHSELLQEGFITALIPFLPLEKRHVKLCIMDVLNEKGYYRSSYKPELLINTIADELHYNPEGVELYSVTGCKRVQDKITFILEDL